MWWIFKKSKKHDPEQQYFVPGLKKSPSDKRDFRSKVTKASERESRYTLSWAIPPIKNQGRIGSCGSHAFASAIETMHKIQKDDISLPLSELHHYYHVRSPSFMNTLPQDSGQYLRDGCKVLHKIGISPESLWPYVPEDYNKKPSMFANAFSRFFKIKGYYRCTNIEQMKSEIFRDHPIVFGVQVFPSFIYNRSSKYGLASMKKHSNGNLAERSAGGHAMVFIGYDDQRHAFLVLNSWGRNWGRGGLVWLSYDYVKKYLIEAWGLEL